VTSTADTDEHTDEHPEAAEISALFEGILPPGRSADLRGHIATCSLCADVRDSLDEIRNILGTLPGQLRMPDDVADRIDAILAAEALIGVTVSKTLPTNTAGELLVSRETLAGETSTRPSGHATAATSPGTPRRRRWVRVVFATACAVAALGMGSVYVHSLAPTKTPQVSVIGEDHLPGKFSGTALEIRVRELLAVADSSHSSERGAQPGNTPMSPDIDSTSIPHCVLQGTGRADRPLGSTHGTYGGRNAYLLVLPHPANMSRVDAFVVDASCAFTPAPAPGRVMTKMTYNR
jgi:hypothetical protein